MVDLRPRHRSLRRISSPLITTSSLRSHSNISPDTSTSSTISNSSSHNHASSSSPPTATITTSSAVTSILPSIASSTFIPSLISPSNSNHSLKRHRATIPKITNLTTVNSSSSPSHKILPPSPPPPPPLKKRRRISATSASTSSPTHPSSPPSLSPTLTKLPSQSSSQLSFPPPSTSSTLHSLPPLPSSTTTTTTTSTNTSTSTTSTAKSPVSPSSNPPSSNIPSLQSSLSSSSYSLPTTTSTVADHLSSSKTLTTSITTNVNMIPSSDASTLPTSVPTPPVPTHLPRQSALNHTISKPLVSLPQNASNSRHTPDTSQLSTASHPSLHSSLKPQKPLHPDAGVEASMRRLIALRNSYRAVLKALRPVLRELAERSISRLRSNEAFHTKCAQYPIVLSDLQLAYEKRINLLQYQFNLDQQIVRRNLLVNNRIVNARFADEIEALRDQWLNICKRSLVELYRRKSNSTLSRISPKSLPECILSSYHSPTPATTPDSPRLAKPFNESTHTFDSNHPILSLFSTPILPESPPLFSTLNHDPDTATDDEMGTLHLNWQLNHPKGKPFVPELRYASRSGLWKDTNKLIGNLTLRNRVENAMYHFVQNYLSRHQNDINSLIGHSHSAFLANLATMSEKDENVTIFSNNIRLLSTAADDIEKSADPKGSQSPIQARSDSDRIPLRRSRRSIVARRAENKRKVEEQRRAEAERRIEAKRRSDARRKAISERKATAQKVIDTSGRQNSPTSSVKSSPLTLSLHANIKQNSQSRDKEETAALALLKLNPVNPKINASSSPLLSPNPSKEDGESNTRKGEFPHHQSDDVNVYEIWQPSTSSRADEFGESRKYENCDSLPYMSGDDTSEHGGSNNAMSKLAITSTVTKKSRSSCGKRISDLLNNTPEACERLISPPNFTISNKSTLKPMRSRHTNHSATTVMLQGTIPVSTFSVRRNDVKLKGKLSQNSFISTNTQQQIQALPTQTVFNANPNDKSQERASRKATKRGGQFWSTFTRNTSVNPSMANTFESSSKPAACNDSSEAFSTVSQSCKPCPLSSTPMLGKKKQNCRESLNSTLPVDSNSTIGPESLSAGYAPVSASPASHSVTKKSSYSTSPVASYDNGIANSFTWDQSNSKSNTGPSVLPSLNGLIPRPSESVIGYSASSENLVSSFSSFSSSRSNDTPPYSNDMGSLNSVYIMENTSGDIRSNASNIFYKPDEHYSNSQITAYGTYMLPNPSQLSYKAYRYPQNHLDGPLGGLVNKTHTVESVMDDVSSASSPVSASLSSTATATSAFTNAVATNSTPMYDSNVYPISSSNVTAKYPTNLNMPPNLADSGGTMTYQFGPVREMSTSRSGVSCSSGSSSRRGNVYDYYENSSIISSENTESNNERLPMGTPYFLNILPAIEPGVMLTCNVDEMNVAKTNDMESFSMGTGHNSGYRDVHPIAIHPSLASLTHPRMAVDSDTSECMPLSNKNAIVRSEFSERGRELTNDPNGDRNETDGNVEGNLGKDRKRRGFRGSSLSRNRRLRGSAEKGKDG